MRRYDALLALLTALCAGGPACAESLQMPDQRPVYVDGYSSPQIAVPWTGDRVTPVVVERPIGELIAARLGLVEGSAELFRYRVENAPSGRTFLDGVVDGGGIKLKLTW